VRAELLHVGDEIPGGVLAQLGVGPALAAAALIEEHDAVCGGIEEAALLRLGAAARAAVHEDHGLAVRVARLLEVDLVQIGDLERPGAVRLDLGIEGAALGGVHRAEEITPGPRRASTTAA